MGTLDITFTGGEALLIKDLPVLFERARSNDLVISLLSNLTLLTDEIIDLLKAENVEMVQTSLYSMDAAVHDSITRRDGSHRQTLAGLEELSLAGIPISIGCPVMRQNRDSFVEVVKYGNANGIPVSCDVAIMAKEDGDTSNLTHRVGASDLEGIIGAVVQNSDKYRDMLEHNRSVVDEVSLDTCGIGNYMLCLKSTGEFLPCPGFGLVVGNAWDSGIADVWMHSPQIIALRQFSRREQFPQCTSCGATAFCNFCLAKFHNEADWRSGQIPFGYCEMAATNRRVALNYLKRTTP
jgi:radical SAM protein with 4Fe4S-binding SPASM domain